jgi:hypothetical protein
LVRVRRHHRSSVRGGITVELCWAKATLTEARLTADRDITINVRIGHRLEPHDLAAGTPLVIA